MPHRMMQVQVTYLTAGALTQVLHIPCASGDGGRQGKVGTQARLFPAYIAGNSAAIVHVLHLEEVAGDAHSKLRYSGPPTAVTALPGLQVSGT